MKLVGSLRVRLTAAFVLLAACALGIGAAATVLLVEQATLGTLDAVLLEEATTLASLVDLPSDRLAATVRDVGAETDLGPGKFVSIADGGGAIVAASSRMPSRVVRQRPVGLSAPRLTTAGGDHARFRVAWAPTAAGGSVAIGVNASRAVRAVQRARWGISVLAAALLVVLGLGAWTITGRATRELDRLAAEVATVEAGSLARRLSARRTDEVERLVTVLNRVLARLDRSVAQLRRFTADAAHELRTPIAALRARLEVALSSDGASVSREIVVDALEQTERLGRLAEDLLMLARVEGGAVASSAMDATVDLTALMREVADELLPIAEEQARELHCAAAPGLCVKGSEPLLKRVFVNLVDNAFRHTPASARIDVTGRRDGEDAVVEVEDGGPGIDPALAPHLFERFRHGPDGGSGLGLALAREIVERHGGRVTITRGAAGGTRVCVALPLATGPGAAASPRRGAA